MSVATEITKPNVSNVFLLEVTAGLDMHGFILHNPTVETEDWGDLTAATETEDWGDLGALSEPSADWEMISFPNTYRITSGLNVTAVKSFLNGTETSLTLRTNVSDVELNSGSFYGDGTYIYVRPATGQSIYTYEYRGTIQFYFGTKAKNLNSQYYDPRLIQIPNLSLRIESRFSGVGQIGSGSCTLINTDGYFDALDELNWDAGTAVFKMGVDSNSTMAYADYTNIGTWRVESTEKDQEKFTLKLREPKTGLNRQIPLAIYERSTYANIKPEDVGKPIPRAYGRILGARPVLIDATLKKFKVAGHAIHSFEECRMQVDNAWVSIPFATKDADNGEFTLGSSWENNEPLSVDFWGMKNSDGTVMVNCADIVENLLSYVGETNLHTASFTASDTALDIGVQHDIYRATLFKPSLYIDSFTTALDVISKINRLASSFLYTDFDGAWRYKVFSPVVVSSAAGAFTEADVVEGSYEKEVETRDVYTKVAVKYGTRKQDGWSQLVEEERKVTAFHHNATTAIVKEIEIELWDTKDATYYAERLLSTEAQPLVRHRLQIPWQAFFVYPGDNIHLKLDRENLNGVFEVLEARHDLVAGRVSLVLGDRRAFGDSFGWWVADGTAAWDPDATDDERATVRQSAGHWHGTDLMANNSDGGSWKTSRWW